MSGSPQLPNSLMTSGSSPRGRASACGLHNQAGRLAKSATRLRQPIAWSGIEKYWWKSAISVARWKFGFSALSHEELSTTSRVGSSALSQSYVCSSQLRSRGSSFIRIPQPSLMIVQITTDGWLPSSSTIAWSVSRPRAPAAEVKRVQLGSSHQTRMPASSAASRYARLRPISRASMNCSP